MSSKKTLVGTAIVAMLLLLSTSLWGQATLVAKAATTMPMATSPAEVGMSAERLERIDRMCSEAIDQNQVPGIVALVARHGKIVYLKAFGMADNAT